MLARLLLVACLAGLAAPAEAIRLTLRKEATPGGSIVRLGDVADIAEVAAGQRDRLAALPLMPAPAPGVVQHLSPSVLRELLAAQGVPVGPRDVLGADAAAITTRALASESLRGRPLTELVDRWRPAEPVADVPDPTLTDGGAGFRLKRSSPVERRPLTRRVVRPNDLREIEDRVRETIADSLASHATETPLAVRSVRLTETAVREFYGLRRQPWTAQLDTLDEPVPGEVRFRVWPESRGPDDAFRVIAELVEQGYHVVASEPMARGALVTASSLRLEPTPVDQPFRGTVPYASIEEVVGKETTRTVRIGQPISTDNVASPLMVRRGETVTVTSGGGGVSVRLAAIAKGDGRVGDLVTVEAYNRNERFDARVVGRRRLAILSAGGGEARLATLHTGGLQ